MSSFGVGASSQDRLSVLRRDQGFSSRPVNGFGQNQGFQPISRTQEISSDVSSRVDQMIKSVRSTTPTKKIETRFSQGTQIKRAPVVYNEHATYNNGNLDFEIPSMGHFGTSDTSLIPSSLGSLKSNLNLIRPPSRLSMKSNDDHQYMIETIKISNEDQRAKFECDLDQERRLRDEQNRRLQSLTEELAMRHHENSELRAKLSQIETHIHSTETDNQRLRDELKRLAELTNSKVRELEDKLNQTIREANTLEQSTITLRNNMMREHESNIQSINKEWDLRVRQLEEQLRNRAGDVKALEAELARTRDISQRLIFESEEKLRGVSLQIREEESRRHTMAIQDVEGKLRVALENRDAVTRKLEDVVKEAEMNDKQNQERVVRLQNEMQRFKHEYSNLQGEVGKMTERTQELMRARDELEKNLLKMSSENTELRDQLKRCEEIYQQETGRMRGEFSIAKREWESNAEAMKRKLSELEALCRQYESEIMRLNTEYRRLVEMMQNNLNQTISTVISEYKGTTGGNGVSRPASAMGGYPSRKDNMFI